MKSLFLANYSKSIKSFVLKISFALISLGIFIFVIYKAYQHVLDPIDLQDIPLIRNTNKPAKKKFNKNDGLIFLNQDKVIYNTIVTKNKLKQEKGLEKISQDFSHQQIFDIVQDIKNQQMKSKQKKVAKNNQKYSKKDVFQILDIKQ